jgi:peptide/nickel transport system permease protein
MANYILRRLFLMIPTLVGITFLVFMLVAMSPGGIGAALRQQAGARQSATQVAIQEAYLDDRYGLDDPPIVQYARWLGRVCPIKFGQRSQVSPAGDLVSPPKPLKTPPLWAWFTDTLPTADPAPPLGAVSGEQLLAGFKEADRTYAQARGQYIADTATLKDALGQYAREKQIPGAIDRDAKVRLRAFRGLEPDRAHSLWPKLEALSQKSLASYKRALDARERLAAAFGAGPYPEAGIGIVPGVVSLAAPDFGTAFSRSQPVMGLIMAALPVTLLLNFIAFPIIYSIAIPSGMLAAWKRGTPLDTGLGTLYILLYSFPTLLAGILCIMFLANKQYLGWFPASDLHSNASGDFRFLPGMVGRESFDGAGNLVTARVWQPGWLGDLVWHVCLPVVCLVYTGFAVLSKQTRAAMLDNFSADYVRTAKAKGVSARDVVLKHVFRNSLLPLITIFVTIFPAMLAGSVVVERVFNIHGMGWLIVEATTLRDRELLLADTLMVAVVSLLALLLADILYAFADPRIAYD